MARAIWNGAINFGLVSIPVRLFGAIRANDLRFHLLHEKDMGRIHNERVCNVCEEHVEWKELVRAYEIERDNFIPITEAELKKATAEATQSVDIVEFVGLNEIDPIFFDTPYYLAPEPRGRHAYTLLCEALQQSERVGIARVVIRTREHLAALKPSDGVLMLELLHWASEVIPRSEYDFPEAKGKLPAAEMKAAMMLIDTMTATFDPQTFHDRYREQVLALIRDRAEGKELPAAKPQKAAGKGKLVDLAAMLQKSLDAAKKRGPARPKRAKAPARAARKAA
ncbi:Ku protein [Pendulispora albinea]|uniref:Non-homologous end joining protein Ku n=1 Tax=Pendulispora albinea TaxID=2741071 RepID=A0ABZ2LNW2_9BACT